MKLSPKYHLYQNKFLQPYIRVLTWGMTVITNLASIAFILSVVYEYGFDISASEQETIETVYQWVWAIFLFDITLHLLFGKRLKEVRYQKLAFLLVVLLYLTLIPVIFSHRPAGAGPFVYIWDVLHSEYYRLIIFFLFSFLNISSVLVRLLGRRTNPSLILAVSFLIIIMIGWGLLMLPHSTVNGISWMDALFLSTSSVCVNGLAPLDMAATFTPFGFTIIIVLAQIGAIGVMTLTSFFALFFMGNTSLYNQLVIRDMVNSDSLGSLLSTLLYILVFTLTIEGIGMLAIWYSIHETMGMTLKEELAFSAFHSISAFCNAGISTLPGGLGNPETMNGHNSLFIFISFLIILGGIGYPILVNIKNITVYHLKSFWNYIRTYKWESEFEYYQFNLNTRIVLVTTLFLIAGGAALILFFEWNHAFAGMPVADKITHAFFNAVSPRSAGFNSVDITTFSIQSILFYILLMWIGGAAQSTTGGIKVNSFAVIVLNLIAVLRGTNRVEVMGRELSTNSIRRANATMVMSLGTIFLFIFLLSILEPELSLLSIVFECFSALSTTGVSLNTTPHLGNISKLLIALLMFVGRVGLITLMLGLVKQKKNTKYKYPSDDIIIN